VTRKKTREYKATLCCLELDEVVTLSPHYLEKYARQDETVRKDWRFDILHFSECLEVDVLADRILETKPDIVGFTTFLWNIDKTIQVSSRLKEKNEKLVVVWGGVEATIQNERYLEQYPCVDIIVIGEGERIFLDLLRVLPSASTAQLAAIKGISFRDQNVVRRTPRAEVVKNLQEIPSVLLRSEGDEAIGPYQMIETARGCYARCAFCVWHRYAPLRYFPLDQVVQEIKYLLAHPRVKDIYFGDSDILASKDRALRVWETVVKYNHRNIRCAFEVNPENIEPEHLDFLKNTEKGHLEFQCAFQTTNPVINKILDRDFNEAKVKKNMMLLRDACRTHRIVIDFTYAWPYQTLATFISDTLDPIMTLDPDYIVGLHFLVLPGTKFHDDPKKYGIIDYEKKAPYRILETEAMSRYDVDNMNTICRCLNAISSRHYVRKSLRYLIPHIKSKSCGEIYAELAMYLISHGGADFSREPFVRGHLMKYAEELALQNSLPGEVFKEFKRIVEWNLSHAPVENPVRFGGGPFSR